MIRPRLLVLVFISILLSSLGLRAAESDLINALNAVRDHINGSATLSDAQMTTHKATIDANVDHFDDSANAINAAFNLVNAYDLQVGALWVQGSPVQLMLRDEMQDSDLEWVVWNVMQNIMDVIYQDGNIDQYEATLNGFEFGSTAHFPGDVDAPVTPSTHTATISGNFKVIRGWRIFKEDLPARRPTGAYVAPGSIVTVAVPASIVGKGYTIRVGTHSWSFNNKNKIRRLDRISSVYSINSTQVKVANPHGGSIYIEVPWDSNDGVFTVNITGAVRSPYFTTKSIQTMTNADWQNVERNHPGPWADFQSDSFMMTVPRSWIYALDDAEGLMAKWDTAIDINDDLMGLYRNRGETGRETMYIQADLTARGSSYFPGYPMSNYRYDPNKNENGYAGNHFIQGPEFAPSYLFHEMGHGYLFPKIGAGGQYNEIESAVNLAHAAIMNQAFGWDLDRALADSRGMAGNPNRTLNNTALTWMTSFNFSPLEVPMHSSEKNYQLQGHAKYVDMAKLFGWESVNGTFRRLVDLPNSPKPEDLTNTDTHFASTDDHLLAMSESAGVDIRPLMAFWGIYPSDPNALAAALQSRGLGPSNEIYDRLYEYRSMVPSNNAKFREFSRNWWGRIPAVTDTDRHAGEHARQWDTQDLASQDPWYTGGSPTTAVLPNGEVYNEASHDRIVARVDELLAEYFPGGDPVPDNTPPTSSPLTWEAEPGQATGSLDRLSATVLSGTNPVTGEAWTMDDTYRLAFVSSTTRDASSHDIEDYNDFVQNAANQSGSNLGNVTWKVIGSTDEVDARDNTSTNTFEDGAGSPIYLVDGETLVAAGNGDLWNGNINVPINMDEKGVGNYDVNVAVGSNGDGSGRDRHLGGDDTPRIDYGRSRSSDGNWVLNFSGSPSSQYHFYALSSPIPVGVSVQMTATSVTDESGVQYYFEEISGNPGGDDSGWQSSPVYVDGGLTDGLTYTYRVRVRDMSSNYNESPVSAAVSVTVALDGDAPRVYQINDDQADNSIWETESVTYRVIFNEAINTATASIADFELEGTAAGTVDSVSASSDPQELVVVASSTTAGTMRLRIKAGATIEDLAGNLMDTSTAYADDEVINVSIYDVTPPSLGSNPWTIRPELNTLASLNALSSSVLSGNNPMTGSPWQPSDFYRLAFVTSAQRNATSGNIEDYNAFVQNAANNSSLGLSEVNWKVIGSTQSVNAQANTATNRSVDGDGEPIYLLDGSTLISKDYKTFWDGRIDAPINIDENGNTGLSVNVALGTDYFGTMHTTRYLGSSSESPPRVQYGLSSKNDPEWIVHFHLPSSGNFSFYALSDPIPLSTSITMTAATVSDPSGVEYYFTETSGNPGGDDSGWQDSPTYTDYGLTINRTYSYTVQVRDKSIEQNESGVSSAVSVEIGTDPNTRPVISGTPATSVNENEAYSFTPSASDADAGDTLSFSIQNKPSWATFNTNTGRLSGTPSSSDAGTTTNIIITVTDGKSSASLASFNLTVNSVNSVPTISGSPNTSVNENASYSFTPSASDADAGDTLSFSIQNKPGWATFNTNTGRLSGTPSYTDAGITTNIIITVTDGTSSASLALFNLTVNNVNRAPSISGSPNTSVSESANYSFTPSVSDADSDDTHVFSIQNKPNWAMFNTNTGELSGAPEYSDLGSYQNIMISVSDGTDTDTLAAFNLTVTALPTSNTLVTGGNDSWNNSGNWSAGVVPNGTAGLAIASGVSAQADNASTPTWNGRLTMQNGSKLIVGAALNTGGEANGANALHGAVNLIMENATIEAESKITLTFPAINLAGNGTITNNGTGSHSQERIFSGVISGSGELTYSGNNNQQLKLQATNTFTGGLVLNAKDRYHVYFEATGSAGAGNVTVNPRTSSEQFRSATLVFNALNVIADTATLTLNGGGYGGTGNDRVRMNYNDTVKALIVDGVQLAAGTYGRAGHGGVDHEVNWIQGNAILTVLSDPSVVNTAPIIGGTPSTSVNEGSAYSFTPSVTDPDAGDVHTFSIQNKPSWASFSTSTGALTGTPGYGDAGTTSGIVITVNDGEDSDSLAAFSITVNNVNRGPSISGAPSTSVNINQSYSFTPTANDPDGNSITFSIQNKPAWATFNTGNGKLSGTPGLVHLGITSNVVISVSDGSTSSSLPAFNLAVIDPSAVNTLEAGGSDSWNNSGSWSFGVVPDGAGDAVIGADVYGQAHNAATPTWSGTLTLQSGSKLRVGYVVGSSDVEGSTNALHGATEIIIEGATIESESKFTLDFPAITLNGDASIVNDGTASHSRARNFSGVISGAGAFAYSGNNNQLVRFQATNTFTGGLVLNAKDRYHVYLEASGSAGAGNVSVNPRSSNEQFRSATLVIDAADAIADTATLTLNGGGHSGNGSDRVIMNNNDTVNALVVDGVQLMSGTYGRSGRGGVDNEVSWMQGNAILTVLSDPSIENTAPVIGGTPLTSVNEGSAYSFTPSVTDPDAGDVHTFTIQNKPSWASFSTSTGVLTGTPGYDDAGTTSGIVITVNDGEDSDSLASFSITVNNVNRAPSISGTPTTSVNINQVYSFTPTANDADGDNITFSIQNKPVWATFNTSNGRLSGTPGLAHLGTTSNIVISVSDGSASSASPAFHLAVIDPSAVNTLQSGGPDSWNNAGSWSFGVVPNGSGDAVIGAGVYGQVHNAATPTWNGTLTLKSGSKLRIGYITGSSDVEGSTNALHGATEFIIEDATIEAESKFTLNFPDITLDGDASIVNDGTASHARERIFAGVISGAGEFAYSGNNRQSVRFQTANAFTGGLVLNAKDRYHVYFEAAGSAGAGNVTVNPRTSSEQFRSATLVFNAADAIADTAILTLNGGGYSGAGTDRVQMNYNDTIGALIVDSAPQSPGTYGRVGHGGVDYEVTWMTGDAVLTVAGVVPTSAYDTWKDTYGSLNNSDARLDFDKGGLATGVEWVLGGNPTDSSDDQSLSPTLTMNSGDYVFTYRRSDLARDDSNTTIAVEYSSDLQTWTTATHGGLIAITEDDDHYGSGSDRVTVTMSSDLASGQKLYVRLKIVVTE